MSQKEAFETHLKNFAKIQKLHNVLAEAKNEHDPSWGNKWFTGLDAAMLHYFIGYQKPRLYLEIGSGNSTKFARHAIGTFDLANKCRIASIDPQPRAEIDDIADIVYRTSLEDLDLSVFNMLQPGDILFLDSSHRCFMASDVTVFFLEVVPRIPRGVLIHIHDIHIPFDYPPHRAEHYESEQYLLAAQLLIAPEKIKVEMPNRFVLSNNAFAELLGPLDVYCKGADQKRKGYRRGSSFWFRYA